MPKSLKQELMKQVNIIPMHNKKLQRSCITAHSSKGNTFFYMR